MRPAAATACRTRHHPPALLGRGLQPVKLAQPGAGASRREVQEGDGPGDRPAPADEAGGGVGAECRQRVASPKPTAG